MGQRPICIYCLAQNVSFNREHVIPEAFGTFKQNLVLHDCVCAGCNGYFGQELDLILSRDSGEALLRLRHGVKPVSKARDLRNTRVKLKINVPGPWYGTQIVLKADETGTKLESEQIPQIGLRKGPGPDFIWYAEDELVEPRKFQQYRERTEIRIVGPSEEAMQRLLGKLGELGIPFKQKGVIDQPLTENGQIEIVALYQIDQIILRAVGKIALNYVASVQGASFALRGDFDEFRRYIRYSEKPSWKPAIRPSSRPILFDDSPSWRQTTGHLITLGWSRNNRGLLVQVSLFNSITYHALLCPDLSGLWHPLSSGHHFDIESRTISKLGSTNRFRMRTVPK